MCHGRLSTHWRTGTLGRTRSTSFGVGVDDHEGRRGGCLVSGASTTKQGGSAQPVGSRAQSWASTGRGRSARALCDRRGKRSSGPQSARPKMRISCRRRPRHRAREGLLCSKLGEWNVSPRCHASSVTLYVASALLLEWHYSPVRLPPPLHAAARVRAWCPGHGPLHLVQCRRCTSVYFCQDLASEEPDA